jgi:hypothetical protein
LLVTTRRSPHGYGRALPVGKVYDTMPRFLIEVPHDSDKVACGRAIQTFLQTGSHFLANAEWGCADGEHKAWLLLDIGSKEDARSILPPSYRSEAKIVSLERYTMKDFEDIQAEEAG